MVHAGVIEPASCEWASPVVLVGKKNGSLRFCVDYRRLNMKTVTDVYPLPRVADCIDLLGDARVFSTLDFNSGYWQIPVDHGDQDKTTFTTHCGTYRYKRIPFGLKNAPATFQRALEIILSCVRSEICLMYLDDVIVFSKDQETHLEHLDTVLSLLRNAGVSLKLNKCFFFRSKLEYLRHFILPSKLSVARDRSAAFRKCRFPQTRTQLRSFLGAYNVYRRFIAGFAKEARPLSAMLCKDVRHRLCRTNGGANRFFRGIATPCRIASYLGVPQGGTALSARDRRFSIPSWLHLASTTRRRYLDAGGFWSKTFNPAEQNYCATERECLAIVWSMRTLRTYLEGTRFTVRTDHDALRWILNLTDLTGRLAR